MMNTTTPRDQFKPIRIGENNVVHGIEYFTLLGCNNSIDLFKSPVLFQLKK